MKFVTFLALAACLSISSLVESPPFFVNAELEKSPPGMTWLRLYERDNCDVKYHEPPYKKDFARVTCGPEVDTTQCVSGVFRSYRLETNPGDHKLPKIDQLIVKYNSTTCNFEPDLSDATIFRPHPHVNLDFFKPGCHAFDPTTPLAIHPESTNSFLCTWATYKDRLAPPAIAPPADGSGGNGDGSGDEVDYSLPPGATGRPGKPGKPGCGQGGQGGKGGPGGPGGGKGGPGGPGGPGGVCPDGQ